MPNMRDPTTGHARLEVYAIPQARHQLRVNIISSSPSREPCRPTPAAGTRQAGAGDSLLRLYLYLGTRGLQIRDASCTHRTWRDLSTQRPRSDRTLGTPSRQSPASSDYPLGGSSSFMTESAHSYITSVVIPASRGTGCHVSSPTAMQATHRAYGRHNWRRSTGVVCGVSVVDIFHIPARGRPHISHTQLSSPAVQTCDSLTSSPHRCGREAPARGGSARPGPWGWRSSHKASPAPLQDRHPDRCPTASCP